MTHTTIAADGPSTGEPVRGRRSTARTVWGVAFTSTVILLALSTLFAVSSPSGDFLILMMLLALWSFLGVVWVGWVVVEVVLAFRGRSAPVRLRRWSWPLVSALVVAVTASLVLANAPLKLRFALTEPSMTDEANELLYGQLESNPPQPVGPYGPHCLRVLCFTKAEKIGQDAYFTVGPERSLAPGEAGFVYSPDGVPAPADDVYSWDFDALGDGWYAYYAS